MDEAKQAVKDLGIDFDDLDVDDIEKLRAGGALNERQAAILHVGKKQSQNKNKAEPAPALLPFPDIAPMTPLTPTQLADLSFPAPAVLKIEGGKPAPPVDLGKLSPGDWMMVFLNCHMSRGRMFDKDLQEPSEHVLLPPNKNIGKHLIVSSTSEYHKTRITTEMQYQKVAAMSEQKAFCKVQTPWVSAATAFNESDEKQEVSKSQKYLAVTKQLAPIGKFHFTSMINAGEFVVNPAFVVKIEQLVKDKSKIKKGDLEEVFQLYGDVFATEFVIGNAMFITASRESKDKQTYEDVALGLSLSLSASVSGYGGEAGGSHQSRNIRDAKVGSASSTNEWVVIGGGTTGGEDLRNLTSFRNDPNSWRIIHYEKFISVLDLLPKKLKDNLFAKSVEDPTPPITPPEFPQHNKVYKLVTSKWPNWHLYIQNNDDGNARGYNVDPGPQGHFLFKKTDWGAWTITTVMWPGYFMYMQNNHDGNVRAWGEDPGPQGHWFIKKCTTGLYTFTTRQWPACFMYMQDVDDGNVRGWDREDPGVQGWWRFLPM